MPTDFPQVCQTAIKGNYQGEDFVNVLHFYKIDGLPMTTGDLVALHAILDDAAADNDSWANIWQTMDANAVVTEFHSRTLSLASPVELISSVNIPGANAGTDALPMLAIMVRWTGPFATRRSRGRTYLCGLTTLHWDPTDTDRVAAATIAALQVNLDQWVAAWQANPTYGHCIFSRKDQEEMNGDGIYDVRGASVSTQVAIQTRRSPNR